MKALICEMCGGKDLVKENGVFVCQNCGCKYSVEEAKKMMVEVDGTIEVTGTVEVKNAAQVESLMKLARSSFESENYAQAEEFCNQAIAMDDKNYDAWKLKAEAINWQITTKNRRILEVYNCLMTSYKVLSEEDKEEKKEEIAKTIYNCLFGEIELWLETFEHQRPSEKVLNEIEDTHIFCWNKLEEAYIEFGLDTDFYLDTFDNLFVTKCSIMCRSVWENVVGYNYFRDDFDNLGEKWLKYIWFETTVYSDPGEFRPSNEIFETFASETKCLISLLKYCEERFNDLTESDTKRIIYSNIAFFNETMKDQVGYIPVAYGPQCRKYSYNIGSRFNDEYKKKCEDESKLYKERARDAKLEIIAKYWEEHAEEKQALDSEKDSILKQIAELNKEKQNIGTEERNILARQIKDLTEQKNTLGLFKAKEKKALQEKIDSASYELNKVDNSIRNTKAEIDKKIESLRIRAKEIVAKLDMER